MKIRNLTIGHTRPYLVTQEILCDPSDPLEEGQDQETIANIG